MMISIFKVRSCYDIIYPENIMVRLIETSSVNAQKFPLWNDWDSKVRKNYDMYQKLIDAKTYQLQRVQRYLLVNNYHNLECEVPTQIQLRFNHPQLAQEEAEDRRSHQPRTRPLLIHRPLCSLQLQKCIRGHIRFLQSRTRCRNWPFCLCHYFQFYSRNQIYVLRCPSDCRILLEQEKSKTGNQNL